MQCDADLLHVEVFVIAWMNVACTTIRSVHRNSIFSEYQLFLCHI